jgi:ETC complex I subunit conserved region
LVALSLSLSPDCQAAWYRLEIARQPNPAVGAGVMREEPMMAARIYKPAKTAMQSGPAGSKEWVLEFEPETPREIEPLMGWTSSRDMKAQIRLNFDTKEEAMAYAERNGIAYRLMQPEPRQVVRKSYADNFRFGRKGAWTH